MVAPNAGRRRPAAAYTSSGGGQRHCARMSALLLTITLLLCHSSAAYGPADEETTATFASLPMESTFSFTLGGVESAMLLPQWMKSVTTYPLRGAGS